MLTILIDETAVMSVQSIFRLADYEMWEGKHTVVCEIWCSTQYNNHIIKGGNSY